MTYHRNPDESQGYCGVCGYAYELLPGHLHACTRYKPEVERQLDRIIQLLEALLESNPKEANNEGESK